MMDDITTTSENKEEKINTSFTNNPSKEGRLVTSQVITVEHSLEIISDLISEIEAKDPQTQTQEEVIIENSKQATYKYRFSLYKKSSVPVPGALTSQLKLFQSFFRSVKATEHSEKILAIRSDVQIYPLTTTDQIMNLEHTGLFNYFKPNKRSQKTIAGDFFDQTKHTFKAFQEHPAMNTWLMQFGYNIAKNSCQTADMVRIGFLSRVRGFTLRNDFQDFITSSPEWRETPFQFRFYFDATGTKGRTAHILMIDVDRPNIEIGLQFFQHWFNGTASNSPNNIAYMFWPLYKKTYSDTDRLKIIVDHHHYIGTDSVVAMKGLHPLETVVCLINGVHTTIRRLLLSMPAQGTATGKLFLQVERQLTNEWLLCSFIS
jgi:hypothetical protein